MFNFISYKIQVTMSSVILKLILISIFIIKREIHTNRMLLKQVNKKCAGVQVIDFIDNSFGCLHNHLINTMNGRRICVATELA